VIDPDGRVADLHLDIDRSVSEPFAKAIRRWRFRPVEVDGRVVRAKAHFRMVGTGESLPGTDKVQLGIGNVWFLDPPGAGGTAGAAQPRLPPPRYPGVAATHGYGATVTLLLKLDGSGRVLDAGVASLSLGAWEIDNVDRAERMAERFARVAIAAARRWSLEGSAVAGSASVMVPVNFLPPQRALDGWQPMIPVDVTLLPWMLAAQAEAAALCPSGQVAASRFQLLDDVAGTSIN